jgi:hypothetical protein
MELGIRLSFVKTSEFRGGGGDEPRTPPLGMPLVENDLKTGACLHRGPVGELERMLVYRGCRGL